MKNNFKQVVVNTLKYNKTVYSVYNAVFSGLFKILAKLIKTDDKLILFNSYAGRRYDDSPKEIFLEMKKDERFSKYRLVWAFHDPSKFDIPDVEKIKTDNFKYFVTALKSRVWITNSSVERGLSFKGKNTFYLNTWHGTPIKFLGKDISETSESFKSKNAVSRYDMFCSQGNYETDIFSKCFNIEKKKIFEIGLPRNDILANYTEDVRNEIRNRLNVKSNQKIVLYCPTFREYEKDKNLSVVLAPPMDLEKWHTMLGDDYVLYIRAHYEVSKTMDIKESDYIKNMSAYPSLNELIIAADILISDYSSIFFDYSITGKPMLHFCYDYDKYSSMRGMYFDIREWIHGADNEDELISAIKEITDTNRSDKTIHFRDNFINSYGDATKKCVDYIADILM